MNIFIDNRQNLIKIDENKENIIESVVREALKEEDRDMEAEVSISFVTNEEIKKLNKEYRGIDRETDVLSFPIEDEFSFLENILGDIIISSEKLIFQAEEYNHSVDRELAYLTVHSMFHLMGYDHIEEEEKKLMRKKEEKVLARLGIARDYR